MNSSKLAYFAVMCALVAVATLIHIPLPQVQGYLNVGDAVIFLAALLFGPLVGAFAGGIGSSLAHLILGYAHWAPWTLVIKGLEGLVVGLLMVRPQVAMLSGAVVMVVGYFIAAVFFYGFSPALTTLPGDLLQGIGSIVIASLAFGPIRHRLGSRIKAIRDRHN